jgi:hypothetical protein
VSTKTISAQSRIFQTNSVFPESQVPSRLIIGFVLQRSQLGTVESNPYNFVRVHEGNFI